MRISGFDDPDSSGWDALHRGTEREGFDSPSKFDMSTLSMIMPKRKPSRPQPDAQGYTDEDTREWGSSADDEDDYAAPEPAPEFDEEPTGRRARRAPEPGALPGRRSREYAGDDFDRREPAGYQGGRSPEYAGDDYDRREPAGYQGGRSPEYAADDHDRRESAGYQGGRSPEYAGDDHDRREPGGYQGGHPGFSDEEPPRPAFGGYRGRRAAEQPLPDPLSFEGTHSPVVAEDGYDPVEPEWQDGDRFEPEPPPLEPAWTPPRGARPPAPPSHQRPPAP
ncbi:DUF742 domain-containing protein, partial [Amycolatopsis sp. A24]